MKRIFVLLSAALLIFAFTSGNTLADVIHVTLTWDGAQLVRTPPGPYHKSAGDTFEVTNNTDFAIWVQLYDSEDHMHGNMIVQPGETDALPLQCNERWVCYQYPVAGDGTKDLVCDQLIPIDQDWPNHKMHYPQRPDPNGWDVMATGNVSLPNATMLADDFQCSETGYIEDIHFWGSWKDDIEGQVVLFHVAIHENIDPGPHGYSEPGAELWFMEVYEPEYIVTPEPPGDQGWYDPISGEVLPNNHQLYYRYDVFLPEGMGYWQTEGEIYWLRIVAFVDDPAGTAWGWKTSIEPQFMDDAVYDSYIEPMGWRELYEPIVMPDPITNVANIAIDPDGVLFDQLTDPDAYGQTWWYYENTEWWNVWWFDHPFDPTHMKNLWLFAIMVPMYPELPAWVQVAFNWSTPEWPPGEPPPIPPLDPVEEDQYIQRQTIFSGEISGETFIEEFWEILEYNPEWVSIDVMGYNFAFVGELTHQCLPRDPQEQSLDLAFVITGEEEEPVYDLWETPEGHNTFVDFGCPSFDPLPSDFFGPGSDPFDGRIDFRGDPLETAPPDVLGPTDTIVKRSRPADLPDCPDSDGPIETQMVALDLVSTAPIMVTYFGGMDPEEWDVRVCLSESVPQPVGSMTFNRNCQEGGTFTAYIPVVPMFIFTRVSDGTEIYYDFGAEGGTIDYEVDDGHWQFIDSFFDVYVSPPEGVLVSNCDDEPDISIGPSAVDLIPGLQADPCEDCVNPPTDYDIPITSLIDPTGLACAQQDIWPPHDVDEDIPTLTEWGMIILALLLLGAGTIAVVRKRKAALARTN